MGNRPIIYLAGPYSHADGSIRLDRYSALTRAAAKIVAAGHVVFSPITMTHPMDLILAEEGQTLGSKFWVEFDEAFMNACAEIWVLMIDGWEQSLGVSREVEFFQGRGLPITYLHPSFATFEAKADL